MTADALDLRELNAALVALLAETSGHSVEEVMLEAGGIVQGAWRDNIASEGLVESGTYLESIAVEILHSDEKGVWVEIASDAADEHGFPYPVALEYGTDDRDATPVGMRAVDTSRRRVVKSVSSSLDHRIKSRVARKR